MKNYSHPNPGLKVKGLMLMAGISRVKDLARFLGYRPNSVYCAIQGTFRSVKIRRRIESFFGEKIWPDKEPDTSQNEAGN